MSATIPWLLMVVWLSYQHGYKQNKLPEPHYFLGATAAISIAALVGTLNKTVGTMFAWALVVGVFVNATGVTPSVPPMSEKKPNEASSGMASPTATGAQAVQQAGNAAGTGGSIIGGAVNISAVQNIARTFPQ